MTNRRFGTKLSPRQIRQVLMQLDSMDFNIDDFNIHSEPLAYSQEQTINFLADREGIFTYYSKLHPDMNGTIIVKSQEDQAILRNPLDINQK